VCSNTTGTIDTERPNIRLTQPGAVATYTWNPGALSGISVMVSPTSTTTYTVTSTFPESGCTASSTVEVTVFDPPTITLGSNPSVCQGSTSANLSYSGTTGSPNQYSVDYDAAANTAGFIDVTNAALPASPIILVVPGAAGLGTYNGTLTVRNSSTTCVSTTYPITVTIIAGPNAGTISGITPLCPNATATYTSNGDPGGTWTSTNTSVATVHPTSGLVTAVAAGTSNITYTVTSGSCTASNFQTVTVDPAIVTNTNDSGAGSLRDVIACVGDGGTVTIDAALTGQTILLTVGQIPIDKNITVVGLGALNVSISGNNFSRIFHVLPGKTLNLQGMTLKDAFATTLGGAVWVEGYLILNNVTIQNCFENFVPKSLTLANPSNLDIIGTVEMKN
jgi:hypothetical protein